MKKIIPLSLLLFASPVFAHVSNDHMQYTDMTHYLTSEGHFGIFGIAALVVVAIYFAVKYSSKSK